MSRSFLLPRRPREPPREEPGRTVYGTSARGLGCHTVTEHALWSRCCSCCCALSTKSKRRYIPRRVAIGASPDAGATTIARGGFHSATPGGGSLVEVQGLQVAGGPPQNETLTILRSL